jgi:hypothetical protein
MPTVISEYRIHTAKPTSIRSEVLAPRLASSNQDFQAKKAQNSKFAPFAGIWRRCQPARGR